MTETASDTLQTALSWHLRLRDGGDADWAAFTDWLADHPDHAAAYAEIEALDTTLNPVLAQADFGPVASNDDAPAPRRRWPWAAGGGAALAAALALALFAGQGSSRYDIATGPGETRTVQLDAGTQVALNGDTRMTFDHANPRFARLDHGEALFSVRHDPQHPFTLTLPQSRVVDVGTVFDVVQLPGQTRVAVAEGAVEYRPEGQAVPLHAGQQLRDDAQDGAVQVSPTDPATVDGWRQRRLTYSGNPLEQVAQDLGRVLGVIIHVDAGVARQPVYGTIDVRRITQARIPLLASALNVRVVHHGKEWILKSAHGPTP
jgi:transmembrane sensor